MRIVSVLSIMSSFIHTCTKKGALKGLPFIFATAAGLIFSPWINISLLKVQEKNKCASLLFVT